MVTHHPTNLIKTVVRYLEHYNYAAAGATVTQL